MISALVFITPLLATSPAAAPPSPSVQEETRTTVDPAETAEDVEIMRRVLVKAINERPGASIRVAPESLPTVFGVYSAQADLLTTSGTGVTHSRAFHVPGAGAVFTLDVDVPVRQVLRTPETDEAEDSDSAWDEARDELHGRARTPEGWFDAVQLPKLAELEIDAEHVDEIQDTILDTLTRFASRIRGLGSSEHLTVVVHLEATNNIANFVGNEEGTSDLFYVGGFAGKPVGAQRLVLRVSLRNVTGRIDDRVDVRRGSVVHRY